MTRTSDSHPPLIEEIELTPLESQGSLVRYFGEKPPKRRRPSLWRAHFDTILIIGLPIAAAFIYFFIIAANYYVSEAKFIIRTNSASGLGGLESLVQSQGLSRATDETYAVDEYIKSRDMAHELVQDDHLRQILGRPESDFLTRFPNFFTENNFEQLYRHYQSWIRVDLDDDTGITTLRAYAYRPDDAQALLSALLKHAEQLTNRLNGRAHDDAVRYASVFVDQEREKVANVEARLTVFRNQRGTVDPSKESVAALGTIGQLNTEVAELEATLRQQIAMMPSSPSIPDLRQRIKSYHDEIDKLRHQVVGGAESTASDLETYESLTLERELAAKSLEAAVANLNKADQEAQQQHLYLETITQPNLPDTPERLTRLLWFFGISAIAIGVWSIIRSLRRGMLGRAS